MQNDIKVDLIDGWSNGFPHAKEIVKKNSLIQNNDSNKRIVTMMHNNVTK